MAALAEAQSHAAVIFTTACDQMRRAADAASARAGSRLFLFNLPATWQTPAARRLYHAEVERLGRFLERLGGQSPTTDQLAAVIREWDKRRARLHEFILRASARAGAAALARFFESGSTPPPNPPPPPSPPPQGVPLALVGGPLLPSQWPLFDAIESARGQVVLNATEPGERCLLPLLPNLAPGQNPLPLLADHYFDHCVDVFPRPNSRLYAWLGHRLAERRVRGVVLWVHVGCDLWRAEATSLREAFRLPVLVLEAQDAGGGSLRELNRLAAFVESLQSAPPGNPGDWRR